MTGEPAGAENPGIEGGRHLIRLVCGVFASLAMAAGARAACPDGAYAVVGPPLLASPAGAFTADVVTIERGTVAIASGCPTVAARIRRTTRGTLVRAAWPSCGAMQRLRLHALVNRPCRTMRGLLSARQPPVVRRFTAINDEAACSRRIPVGCPCVANADCATAAPLVGGTLYCARSDGTCSEAGRCRVRPRSCDAGAAPVCGCDGTTYASRCEAAHAGVSVARTGPCDGGPTVCGGIAGVPCPAGEFCELPARQCDGADLQGTCRPRPGACVQVYDPVCGCDGVTYPNDCARQTAGAQLAHAGACRDDCATACDCEKSRALPAWCSALACPACECRWTCEQGTCAVHIGAIVDPPVCGS